MSSSTAQEETPNPAELQKNEEITRAQNEAREKDANTVKLLLLGAGDSGKTTLRKQFRNLYGAGFTEESRNDFKGIIMSVLFDGTTAVLEAMSTSLHLELSTPNALQASTRILNVKNKPRVEVTDEEAADLNTIHADPNFIAAIARSSEFQLQDCWKTYVEALRSYPAWGSAKWLPSISDCVAARVRTSGIQQEDIVLDNVTFKIFDVGGQRAERRKWVSCFDSVTGVIFVASCSEYDQVLFEDKSKNRLEESIELFGEMCNHVSFVSTPFILFLNKKDLFDKKFMIQGIPLNATGKFPNAPKGTNDAKAALEWIQKQFLSQNKTTRKIFVHVTTAVDPDNVKRVFDACKQILLSQAMNAGGFAS
jgi:guanine nucleotide-binding protein G(i) subunit alpha